ncbi:hypothetical protein SAMN04244559_00775 [Magnetospirillum fulvum]|uniref:Uncharacterized protein n=1 Tax=Magnetospirillum fulvum TaxID=1082 RepID=A0A1H6H408_MAGFU|nr:hypothetical protein SAMN04244559_00775 [Magnetospirillum fulvum]
MTSDQVAVGTAALTGGVWDIRPRVIAQAIEITERVLPHHFRPRFAAKAAGVWYPRPLCGRSSL